MSGLDRYRSMRDFNATAEPRGKASAKNARPARKPRPGLYVMQKHAARRLHYDLRLELGGVLKSWAVTRGPSLVPGEKRLAVETEDHPLEYATFEGSIPKGSYGAGDVIVWDRGAWKPMGDAEAQLKKGHLEFELTGDKLNGRWHLVRMKEKPGEKRTNWLLIKADDEAALAAGDADIIESAPQSVLSGKPLRKTVGETVGGHGKQPGRSALVLPKRLLASAKKSPLIEAQPSLPKLVTAPPSGDRWVHELKYDGYRILATLDAGKVKLTSRNGLDWSARFGKRLPAALKALKVRSAVLDGEIIVPDAQSVASFSKLQEALSAGRSEDFVYVMFDLLYLDGYDLRGLPQSARRSALEAVEATSPADALRLSEQFLAAPKKVLAEVCRLGMEGVVSKTLASPYLSGRTASWLKSKCSLADDFLIAGYLPSSTSDKAIGALAVAVQSKTSLTYAGRVGTGFSERVSRDLWSRLQPLRLPAGEHPFDKNPDAKVTWVTPSLIAEVSFTGWTRDRVLRHAVFKRLRDDKQEASEGPVAKASPKPKIRAATRNAAPRIALTHPDRIYWPAAGVSKQGLLDYYEQIWPLMKEHIIDRPLSLKRYPEGITAEGFFQKNPWRGMSKAIVVTKSSKGGEDLLTIETFDGLAALVQSAALEIHIWGSTLADVEKPDRIVFDLDPADGVAWDTVQEGAQIVRGALETLGFVPEPLVTGGKGIHVCARVKPDLDWTEAKAFTRSIAADLVRAHPDRFTAQLSIQKRKGLIFVDYLRNGRGATAICPYSARAREGAPLALPLTWPMLKRTPSADAYTIEGLMSRHPTTSPWKATDRPSLARAAKDRR